MQSHQSAVSGSENWETYTDASDADEPDARAAYYAKTRTVKRLTPEGGYDGFMQADMGKRVKGGYGLGIKNAPKVGAGGGVLRTVREGAVVDVGRECSETAWTDDGSVF